MDDQPAVGDVLEKQNRKLSILYEIALSVGRSLDLKTILDDALARILNFMCVDAGVIYVINEETLEMVPVAFRNLTEEVVRDLTENRVRVGECMCGNIAQCDREVIILEKASLDPRFTRGVLRNEGMEFYAGLPIRSKNKVVGVLCVITHAPYAADPDLLDTLRAATMPIGLAIENAIMFRRESQDRGSLVDFKGIITNSPRMHDVLRMVKKIMNVPSSIFICGESGTGKELIARAIHFNSIRQDRPFIPINCAALPESLLESELFGYVRGAFTGATADRTGFLEAANGGTLFLDEINSMSSTLQQKLLRFLQDQTFYRIGSPQSVQVDVRIIAATNQKIEDRIREGTFREDLFYRLNVMRIDLPPLRERKEDIPLLARYFVGKYSRKFGKGASGISDSALLLLMTYAWPGNIRELENAVERAVIMAEGQEILPHDLPPQITATLPDAADMTIERMEREHIQNVMNITHGDARKAAKILGIDKTTLWRKLKKFKSAEN